MTSLKLTSYARHGGCSCKLDAHSLEQLRALPELQAAMLEGSASDDAAIIPIGDGRALLMSIDFQNMIVDDAELAGEIAARNALSDLFACGVRPMYADVVLIVPYGDQSGEIGKGLMRGVAKACLADGCAIVGGHTIQGETPVVGLSVTAIAKLDHIKRKAGAQPGDILVLSKPLGTGIAVAARQQGALKDCDYAAAIGVLQQSNSIGALLGELAGVTAMTDVTGFGLLGHMSEVADGSGVTLRLYFDNVPVLPGALGAAREGAVPLLGQFNLDAYSGRTRFDETIRPHEKLLLSDPQTNGGLLVCVRPEEKENVVATLHANGCDAWIIGSAGVRGADGSWVEVER